MPEPPNFEQIARQVCDTYGGDPFPTEYMCEGIAEQLRQVWNARGAADAALFKKYVDKVEWNEGVDFLYEEDWTPEEWRAIRFALDQ